jgi:hypothetical protein
VSTQLSRLAALPTLAACVFVLAAGLGVGARPAGGALASGASTVAAPLPSGTETAGGAWAVLPMGLLSDPSNTFWQVLHTPPGTGSSSHWSVVTPQGVADNGGLVAGASTNSVVVGTLPSKFLTFSPLSVSVDNGTSWSPAFLPGALAARPDALADVGGTNGGSFAIVGSTVLRAGQGAAAWSSLVTLRRLRQVSPRCDATALDAVAAMPSGSPLIATGCGRGGTVAVFTTSGGSWRQVGTTLHPSFAGWSTSVLRLESNGPATTAVVTAAHGGHAVVVALWQNGGQWSESVPLPVTSNTPLLASSVGAAGTVAVLVGPARAPVAYDLSPGGRWTRLPPLPPATRALGPLETGVGFGGSVIDAFTVSGGTELGVYALTPSGTSWAKVQSTEVPLAYGSSG